MSKPSLLTPKKLNTLKLLLDDESPVVRRALLAEFKRDKEAAICFLLKLSKQESIHSLSAFGFLEELGYVDTVVEFVDFIHSFNYELETGLLMLDRTVYPEINPSDTCKILDDIANRVKELLVPPMSAKSQCLVLNRVLFHELGFRGNLEDYYNPENAFLHKVLENKTGLPLLLSALYILVADRCNLQLEPIALPGHFLVACFDEELPFFIDVFEGGNFKTVEEIASAFNFEIDEKLIFHLAPSPVGEILCRNCRNLIHQYRKCSDKDLADLFKRFVKEFEEAYKKQA